MSEIIYEICNSTEDMEAAYALAVRAAEEFNTLTPDKPIYEIRFDARELTIGRLGSQVISMALWHLDGDIIKNTYAIVHPDYRRQKVCRQMREWDSTYWKSIGAISHESMVPDNMTWRHTELEGLGAIHTTNTTINDVPYRVYRRAL